MKRFALPFAAVIAGAALVATAPPASAAEYTISGRAVDSRTENGLGGVVVTARNILDRSIVYARTTTGPKGYFTLTLSAAEANEEEFALRFNGSDVGHETGFLSCNHTVVQSWGNACSAGLGRVGWARMQRI